MPQVDGSLPADYSAVAGSVPGDCSAAPSADGLAEPEQSRQAARSGPVGCSDGFRAGYPVGARSASQVLPVALA